MSGMKTRLQGWWSLVALVVSFCCDRAGMRQRSKMNIIVKILFIVIVFYFSHTKIQHPEPLVKTFSQVENRFFLNLPSIKSCDGVVATKLSYFYILHV